jgi:hypothetical protein
MLRTTIPPIQKPIAHTPIEAFKNICELSRLREEALCLCCGRSGDRIIANDSHRRSSCSTSSSAGRDGAGNRRRRSTGGRSRRQIRFAHQFPPVSRAIRQAAVVGTTSCAIRLRAHHGVVQRAFRASTMGRAARPTFQRTVTGGPVRATQSIVKNHRLLPRTRLGQCMAERAIVLVLLLLEKRSGNFKSQEEEDDHLRNFLDCQHLVLSCCESSRKSKLICFSSSYCNLPPKLERQIFCEKNFGSRETRLCDRVYLKQ